MRGRRPPTPIVVTQVGVNRDISSTECRQAYPFLPRSSDWRAHRTDVQARDRYLVSNDTYAYAQIKQEYPDFRPPRTCRLSRRAVARIRLEQWLRRLEQCLANCLPRCSLA